MELWFIYALLGAFCSGCMAFLMKVSVVRGYDTYLINAAMGLVSASITFGVLFHLGTWTQVTSYGLFLGFVGGILFLPQQIMRLDALRYIDTTIFFPIYKVLGPALATLFAVYLLKEPVTNFQMLGIIFTCLVPMLLVTPKEFDRQKDLTRGLMLTCAATVIASITIYINALAMREDAGGIFHFMLIAEVITCLASAGLFLREWRGGKRHFPHHDILPFLGIAFACGACSLLAFYFVLLSLGGQLAIAYAVNAHYILIPVVLSVWLFKEHWNTQKAIALFLSIASIIFMHR